MLDPTDHNLARQNPADYVKGIEVTVKAAIAEAKSNVESFEASQIIGIGIDTTGSTPIPVDEDGTPRRIPGSSRPMALLGTLIIWFGWFGFNGGSTLAFNDQVPRVLVNTTLAGAAGMVAGLALG